jgi:uncharacterized membrane protein YhhN
MSATFTTFWIAGSLTALLWAHWNGHHRLSAIGKVSASFGFVSLGWQLALPSPTIGVWMMGGLLLSALGDVALIGKSKDALRVGLGCFLLAHLFYSVAFLLAGGLGTGLLVGVVYALIAKRIWRWLAPHVGGLRLPVIAYVVVISLVATASTSCFVADIRLATALLAVSAIMFFLSDLAVARERFICMGRRNRMLGLPLYYAAQVGFCYAVAMI